MESWHQILIVAGSSLGGLATGAILVYSKFRSARTTADAEAVAAKIKADADLATAKVKAEAESEHARRDRQINLEEAWKRLIDGQEQEITRQRETYRAELERLRTKDADQQKELDKLRDEHMECEKNNATMVERLAQLEIRQNEMRKELDRKYDLFALLAANKAIQLPPTDPGLLEIPKPKVEVK